MGRYTPIKTGMSAVERKDCSRLQRSFCVCVLLLSCICLFAACIVVPPSAITISHPGWRIIRGQARMVLPAKSNVLLVREQKASKPNAGLLQTRRRPCSSSRKLLVTGNYSGAGEALSHVTAAARDKVERMGDEGCSMEDIAIVQGEIGPMPDGIPSFAVQILNLCLGGCPIRDIHVSCGWFASATLVNPALFKRVGFDDCVVKEGHALAAGETLSFQYANSFQYPFSLSSASFTCP